jgi:hypothetical protein
MKKLLLLIPVALLVGCTGVPIRVTTPWVDVSSSKSGTVSIYPKPLVINEK